MVMNPLTCKEGQAFCSSCNLFVSNSISKLRVFCLNTSSLQADDKHSSPRCPWQGPLSERDLHLEESCAFVEVECSLHVEKRRSADLTRNQPAASPNSGALYVPKEFRQQSMRRHPASRIHN
eukprot:2724206-Rhodomonas_salina.2